MGFSTRHCSRRTPSSATITCFFSEVILTSSSLATYFSSDRSSSYTYSSPASLGYSYSSEVVGREATKWMEKEEMTRRRVREEEIILTLLIGSMTLLPINVTLKGCEVEVMQKTFNTFHIFPNFKKLS